MASGAPAREPSAAGWILTGLSRTDGSPAAVPRKELVAPGAPHALATTAMMERLCDIRYTASIETIDNGRAGMLLGALNSDRYLRPQT
ncbi:hypothetical protein [Streptomyces triculaminicus]|uniref:hypothetical protein n=1 Tax=Streptomyces triculaminicus TaxID=2816232 RepID=UPI0037A94955